MTISALRIPARLGLIGSAAIALFAATPAMAADFMFEFSGTSFFGGTPIVGKGTVTTDGASFVNQLNGYTAQKITGISGVFNNSKITGLATPFGANNLLYTSGPFFVDGNGLGFATASGISVDLFVTNDTAYRVNTMGAGLLTGLVSASVTPVAATAAVPEPATWAMMLVGFGMIGAAMRSAKRRQKLTVSYA